MPFFNRLRRNSMATERYVHQTSVYNVAKKHEPYQSQRQDSGDKASHVLAEKDIPSEVGLRGPASEISLRSEYTHLDNDTNRYPKLARSMSGSSHGTQARHHRNQPKGEQKNAQPTVRESAEVQLSPMLAVATLPIKWDVRDSPAHIRQYRPDTQQNITLLSPALSTKSRSICVISQDIPWTWAISTQDSRPLTVIDVLEAIHQSLQKEVRRSEWALAQDVQRYIMLKANKARRKSTVAVGIRRVDWLGIRIMFKGLEKDEDLARKRLMPGDQPNEVWVARFGAMR